MHLATSGIETYDNVTSRMVFWGVEFDSGFYFGRWNFSVAMDTGVLVFFVFHHLSAKIDPFSAIFGCHGEK